MKRFFTIALLVVLCFAAACTPVATPVTSPGTASATFTLPASTLQPTIIPTPTTPTLTPLPSQDVWAYTFDRYCLSKQAEQFLGTDIEAFRKVIDALYAGNQSVTIGQVRDWDYLRRIIMEFFVPSNLLDIERYKTDDAPIEYDKASGTVRIFYTLEKQEYLNRIVDFCNLIEDIINGYVTHPQDDALTAMQLYAYVVNSMTYELDYNLCVYDAFLTGTAYCQTYAGAYQFLLWQMGIPCWLSAYVSQQEGHMWNIVLLDGEYYHMDPTWEDRNSFYMFGMSDAYCKATGHSTPFINPADPYLDGKKCAKIYCTSERFADLHA